MGILKFGIKGKEWSIIQKIFEEHKHIEKVIIYGERLSENYHRFANIDLTLKGPKLSSLDLFSVETLLYMSSLPYRCNVSLYNELEDLALIDHINRRGITIYERC